MSEGKKNVRIVDIAQMAGVSPGTVDRVLHGRGRVSPEKKEAIEKVLNEINYKPNIIARSLAMKKNFVIAVFIPYFEVGSYWDILNAGIAKAANELQNFNIEVEYVYFDQYDIKSFYEKSKFIASESFSAVLMAPLFKNPTMWLSQELDNAEIPYVYIDSNVQDQHNLAYFGANSFDSGVLTAKLLFYEIDKKSDIIIAKIASHGDDDSTQTYARERGFLSYLDQIRFKGNLHEIKLQPQSQSPSKDIVDVVKSGNVRGGVMFNSRIYELAFLLYRQIGLKEKNIKLVGYDLIEKNIAALKNEEVSFLLSQRSDMQGYNGIKALSNYLLFRKEATKENYMAIDILVKENIGYYNNDSL